MPWTRTAAAILVTAIVAVAQPAADKGRIEGTVLNSITGQPVRKARIALSPTHGGDEVLAATDSHGRYSLTNVTPGTYLLTATRDGYLGQRYGAKKPGDEQKGESLELTAGSVKSAVDLRMTPLGSISGFVRDEDGDPVREVDVAVMAYGYGPSGKTLRMSGNVQTDALGEYRLFDLPPNTYYLRVKPVSAQAPTVEQASEAYAAVFYPNAPHQSDAAALDLAAGQELKGIDFVLHPVAVSLVRGHIIPPVGGRGCRVHLEAGDEEPQTGFIDGAMAVSTVVSGSNGVQLNFKLPTGKSVDQDLKFEFRNVPLGEHSLDAACAVGEQTYSTRLPILLGAGGLDNQEVRPVAPSTIRCQLHLEGESKSNLVDTQIWVGQKSESDTFTINGTGGTDPSVNHAKEDGTFSFGDLSPQVYRILVHPPDGLYVKSIAEDGRDVRESGVDLTAGGRSATLQVVLSANGGSIEGSVENGAGAKVTLIPLDPLEARTSAKTATAGPDGHFSFEVLPPGRYKLFAWDDPDVDAVMYDAESRKPYESKGQTVEVAERQKATAQLVLIAKVEK